MCANRVGAPRRRGDAGAPFSWPRRRPSRFLASAGLLDEYRICTSPVINGGEPLFRPASTGTVDLLDTKVFATGAVIHAHRPTSTL